jgi:hypothetical protein
MSVTVCKTNGKLYSIYIGGENLIPFLDFIESVYNLSEYHTSSNIKGKEVFTILMKDFQNESI